MKRSNADAEFELLSPAGNLPSFYAAINAGADAVYLGASQFGARASAGFDNASMQTAIRTAHLYCKKIYIALNTLIKQNEFTQAVNLLNLINDLNADAVIIQDLGLLRFIKNSIPQLPIHASTQMSIHNAAGAQLLQDLGVNRVVLARECTLDTITRVSALDIQTEIFVHGAQCVSVSGQCLLSSQIGGRSGNRGTCAQPCRLQYEYRGKKGAWLSPRDMALIDRIPDLYAAGVTSLKIEGRLKRPEYVATVTKTYRKAIDLFLEGRFKPGQIIDKRELLQVFNRGGFTQGWAFPQSDAPIINPNRVSHEGLFLGCVYSTKKITGAYLSEVKLSAQLQQGDQLQIRGFSDQELMYSGPQMNIGQIAMVRHYHAAKPGDQVFKLADVQLLYQTAQWTDKPIMKLGIGAFLNTEMGKAAELILTRGEISVSTSGDIVQFAKTQGMTPQSTIQAISKTNNSPFFIDKFNFSSDGDCFLQLSSLNSLRRAALIRLENALIQSHKRDIARVPCSGFTHINFSHEKINSSAEKTPQAALYVKTHRLNLYHEIKNAGPVHFLYSPYDYTSSVLEEDCKRLGPEDYLCLPRQANDDTLSVLKNLASRLGLSILADNISQLSQPTNKKLMAGYGIPSWNLEALRLIRETGCETVVLSPELSKEEVQEIIEKEASVVLPVYGRTEVMLLNHCPERTFRGLGDNHNNCELCSIDQGTRGQSLQDRMEANFPLSPVRLPEGCLNLLLFHTPLNLSKKSAGKRWFLNFTIEDDSAIVQITRYYAELLMGNSPLPQLPVPLYAGRFNEGVM